MTLDAEFVLDRVELRYADLLAFLDRVAPAAVPVTDSVMENVGPVGSQPVAVYRGWAHLLLDDRASAAKYGHAVLDFVSRQTETPRNRFFLKLLAAEGYAFMGERGRAAAAARASLELAPQSRNAITWFSVAAVAARLYAWFGAQDDAVALLEQLATATPGLAPGLIVRDPLYSVPLARNQRYRALAGQLEEQIREFGHR